MPTMISNLVRGYFKAAAIRMTGEKRGTPGGAIDAKASATPDPDCTRDCRKWSRRLGIHFSRPFSPPLRPIQSVVQPPTTDPEPAIKA